MWYNQKSWQLQILAAAERGSSITSLQLCAAVIIIDSSFKSITLVAASTGRLRDVCVNGLKEVWKATTGLSFLLGPSDGSSHRQVSEVMSSLSAKNPHASVHTDFDGGELNSAEFSWIQRIATNSNPIAKCIYSIKFQHISYRNEFQSQCSWSLQSVKLLIHFLIRVLTWMCVPNFRSRRVKNLVRLRMKKTT